MWRRTTYALLLAAVVAGCGGGAAATTPTHAAAPRDFGTFVSAAFRHAACMRSHGVPSYPDPVVVSHGNEQGIKQTLSPGTVNSATFAAADRACAGILPMPRDSAESVQMRRQREIGLLSFARCMRANGVPNFPDPSAQGQITAQALANAGIDVHMRYVIDAAVKCIPQSHGVLTRAAIANAVSRGG